MYILDTPQYCVLLLLQLLSVAVVVEAEVVGEEVVAVVITSVEVIVF